MDTCQCLSATPTYPTYRTDPHLRGCPEYARAKLPALDREVTVLLNALYDATGTTDPDDLQDWFEHRIAGTDERYPGMIGRLRAILRELHTA